jgi:hypothetical protein
MFPILVTSLFLFVTPALAQTDSISNTTSVNDTSIATEDTEYEGIVVDEQTELPSEFGLFIRSIRERLALALTFNNNLKAERAIKYAEERMLIAEKMYEKSDGEKLRLRARRMLEIANNMMDESENKEDAALENPNEETERLLRNRAKQLERHRRIMDRLEEKATDETKNEILELREEMALRARRLENAINNEKIPEEIRDHLQDVKDRIEAHALEIREHIEAAKALRERVAQGEEKAEEELKQLEERRREMVKQKVEEAKELIKRRREMMQKELEDKIELEKRRRAAAEEAGETEEAEEVEEVGE